MLREQCRNDKTANFQSKATKADNNVAKYKCKVVNSEAGNEDGARLKNFLGSYGGGALPLSITNNNNGTLNDASSTKQTLLK
jgi:hypothetical protein